MHFAFLCRFAISKDEYFNRAILEFILLYKIQINLIAIIGSIYNPDARLIL